MRFRFSCRRLWLFLCLFCSLGPVSPLSAGSGEIQDGKLNLLVYFAYDEADPSSWIPVFDEYSKLMLNSTEGALQLGSVQFTRCPDLQNEADIWVLNDFSGARSHLSGLGRAGLHMTISQIHKSSSGSSLGQFGLLHESGHYLFGCYDEYLGYIGNLRQRSPSHFCTLDLAGSGCIMDGGTSVVPNNARTEWCTDTNLELIDTRHNQGVAGIHPGTGASAAIVTDQEYFLGRSCWSQLARSGVGSLGNQLVEPSTLPPPHEAVVYDLSRLNGDLALSLVIDVSGSMSAEGRLTQAILGGQVGVGLLRPEESLSIVAFSDAPQVVFSQQGMSSAAKNNANNALGNLVAGGGTASGLAIISAVNQLARVSGCVEFIILVSDGVSAAPNLSDPSVTSALAAGGQAVYAVAIGSFPDVAALNAIASSSGGAFYSVSDSSEIPGVLADIFSTAGSGTPVTRVAGEQVPMGLSFDQTFDVAARDEELRLSLSFDPAASLELVLRGPDGVDIFAKAPPQGVSVFASPGSISMSIPDPQAGAWSARVEDPFSSAATFELLVFVEGAQLDVNTLAPKALVTYPEPMQLSVSLVAGVPVGGAQVEATVRRPDGSSVPCTLFDDGLAVHADEKAGDGVYSTLFGRYVGDGPYAFDILIDAQGAQAASNEECGIYGKGSGEDGQSVFAVDGFQACANHTLLLEGQTSFPTSGGSGVLVPHPGFVPVDTLGVFNSAPTPVAAFGIQVEPGEPLILESLDLDFPRQGSQSDLAQGMALHLDRDGDGVLDVPSVPLALGVLSTDGSRIEFQQATGALARLELGSTPLFLLTLGEAPPSQALRDASDAGLLGGWTSLGARAWPNVVRWLLVGAALWLLLRCLRPRSLDHKRHRWQPITLSLLLLVLAVPACGSGGGGGLAPSSSSAAQEFRLLPAGLGLRGAVSHMPSSSSGSALSYELDLLGP